MQEASKLPRDASRQLQVQRFIDSYKNTQKDAMRSQVRALDESYGELQGVQTDVSIFERSNEGKLFLLSDTEV